MNNTILPFVATPRRRHLFATWVCSAALSVLLLGGCSSNVNTGSPAAGSASTPQSTAAAPSEPGGAASPTSPATPAETAPTTATPAMTTPAATASPLSAAEETLASMSLEQKIGQMLLVGIDGTKLDAKARSMISEDQVGGIILYADNISGLKSMVSLINELKRSNRGNPAPLWISVDQEGGKVSRLPKEYATFLANGTVGAQGDSRTAGTMGRLLARAVKSAGFNMNFAPVLDIASNPDNPIIGTRSFGSTAEQVTDLGIAEMKGIADEGVVPVVKHFPGHGDTSVDSHLELPVVNKSRDELAALEWLPFQAAVQEQADAVMIAHILFPQLDPDKPASLSVPVIKELLRGEMGYQGVVITDDLTMGAIVKNYTLAAAAVDTVQAGSDILLVAHEYGNEQAVRKALLAAVKDGTITEARIDESVLRILALKDKYKLSDEAVPVPELSGLNREIKSWRASLAVQ
ncbi:beta-N-acetylhexosaminidase [Paenibacillus tepidiphilus]|uniref:beta-N-acetylhexosaminidase n=1 Tax=Paenibacillus tepidiphilus TaxID=2608683 RepID=UPI00123970D3|nr:beta-N-acetylhexosaminidase [Paenibacillus tepidiphilus]